MSDRPPEAFLDAMKTQLTCQTCLSIFQDPRNLPCGHSICYHCYSQQFDSQNRSVSCIVCRKDSKTKPESLPVDHSIKGILEVYQSFHTSSSPANESPASSVDDIRTTTCAFPGCTKFAEANGPISQLKFCQYHFDEDVKKLMTLNEELNKDYNAQFGSYSSLSLGIAALEVVIATTTARHVEVGPVFRQLEKALTMKREELEAGYESKLDYLLKELRRLKETQESLLSKKSSLDMFIRSKNYEAAEKLIRQLKCLLQPSEKPERYFAACVTQDIEKLSTKVNRELEKCLFHETEREAVCSPQDLSEFLRRDDNSEIDLQGEVISITFCADTTGYFHDASATDCQALGVTGKVSKTRTNEPLPRQCILCCLRDVSNAFVVHSMDGCKIVSLISLANVQSSLNNNSVCLYDENSRSLFLSHVILKRHTVSRIDLCGEVYCYFRSDFSVLSLDFQMELKEARLDNGDGVTKLGCLAVLSNNHNYHLYRKSGLSSYGSSSQHAKIQSRVNLYSVQKAAITHSKCISIVGVVDDVRLMRNDKVFIHPMDTYSIKIYSTQTGQLEKAVQLSGLTNMPMEMCLASREDILFVKERQTSRVACFDAESWKLLGFLPLNNPELNSTSVVEQFGRMCLCTSSTKGLQGVLYLDLSGKRIHIVEF